MLTRRRVIYVHGYDPQGAGGYYRLFQKQLAKFQGIWRVNADLGELAIESDDIASWTITTTGANWQVSTRYDFIRYEDIITANLAEPIVRQIARAVRWMFDDLVTGTAIRIFRAAWSFGMHHLVVQLLLLIWVGMSIAVGALAGIAARDVFAQRASIGFVIAATISILIFIALRPLAERWFVIRVNNIWPYLREFGRGQATCFDRPIEAGAARLKALVDAHDADEIVIIGHSGGGPLVPGMVARALELDPDLGRRGPRVVMLTIGSIMPAIALHPQAFRMREIIRRLAIEPSVLWIDCQSRKDAMNFWDFDPVEGVGVHIGPERCNPLVWQVRFRDMLSPEFYRQLRWNIFRLHFQFIMANDKRAPYDFFMLVCGPVPVADWATRKWEVVDKFSPEGMYLEVSLSSPLELER